MPDANEAAFPYPLEKDHYGLTKREYFAARALQGLLSDHTLNKDPDFQSARDYAEAAVDFADELIAVLTQACEPA